jgi:uncharacterized membrane protein
MSWLLLALLAPALDTIVNFVDKYLVEHKLKDSRSVPVYSGLAALIFGTAVWLLAGAPFLSGRNAIILIVSGMVFMWGIALYFHALAKSQTSYIIALLQTVPIFILILSVILLDEPLTALQLVGFVLVLGAALGMSVDKLERRIKLTNAFYQIMAANLLIAISAVLIEYTVNLEGFIPILAYESWGFALGSAALFLAFKRVRRAFLQGFRQVGASTLAVMFLNDSLAAISQAVTFLAITLGPVALIGVLSGTQVFYGILYGGVLTLLFPKIFKEDIAKKDIARNVALSVVLFIGVLCIGLA